MMGASIKPRLAALLAALLAGIALAQGLAAPVHAATATGVTTAADSRKLLGEIVQCRVSFDRLAAFNEQVDRHAVGLPSATTLGGAPGVAWKVDPALSTLGVSSDTVLLNSRSAVFLVVASAHPVEDLLAMVPREGLRVELRMGQDAIVRKDLDADHALRAFTIDEGHYAAGCVYDEQAFLKARAARENATPARRAEKKALQDALKD
ncbi:hypothetical protein [Burkholderia gladioli]|uniref:hypothetical protein n=1 Tax=Burkholderia gladioli TaxID=28095 RepID=UPI0011B2593A|nr:hypothetical protein [Burkholderia gladioli]KAF1061743.1 hypothetical protein LvStA_00356 [Burkholderia gladioli]